MSQAVGLQKSVSERKKGKPSCNGFFCCKCSLYLLSVLKPAIHPHLVNSSSTHSILLVAARASHLGQHLLPRQCAGQEPFASIQEDDEGRQPELCGLEQQRHE